MESKVLKETPETNNTKQITRNLESQDRQEKELSVPNRHPCLFGVRKPTRMPGERYSLFTCLVHTCKIKTSLSINSIQVYKSQESQRETSSHWLFYVYSTVTAFAKLRGLSTSNPR